jgi:hypothetical protein
MLTSINSAPLVSESRQAHQRKSESALQWTGIIHSHRNRRVLNGGIVSAREVEWR